MDFLSDHERKLSDFEDPEMNEVLETDMFVTTSMGDHGEEDSFMRLPTLSDSDHGDWFNSIFDEHGLVYNDKNLGEAASQPCIKSEHSYSASNLCPSSPLDLHKEEMDAPICQSPNSSLELTQKSQLIHAAATATQPQCFKYDALDSDPLLMTITSTAASTALTHPTKIIVTASSSAQGLNRQAVFPSTTTVHFKTEPMEDHEQEQRVNVDTVIMPPTPPSSAGSDSDGSQSPPRSAPNSPQRQSPMPQSGVLILTEEEKRTLISEGYPVPCKLPLTKQEEKNLKKVRRKIKNKISAQESRRKKKEYVEALEKRVEAFNHENSDLKKKVESLESNNRSLLGQLQKLQALVSKVPQTAAASATHTGTVLMVLVLCFAVFLGGSGLGPSSLNVGYSGVGRVPLALQSAPVSLHAPPDAGVKPARPDSSADDYTTPNLKSRVLLALSREDLDDYCEEDRPLISWGRDVSCALDREPGFEPPVNSPGSEDPRVDEDVLFSSTTDKTGQQAATVVRVAVDSEINATANVEDQQAMMHPDIAVEPSLGSLPNITADLETA